MRAVVQRVHSATCEVNGSSTGDIGEGLIVFLGIKQGDTDDDLDKLLDKIPNLRIFENEEGNMDRSVKDIGGGILVIPQFTLYGDVSKGRRPSFNRAESPGRAEELYEQFLSRLREDFSPVEEGAFAEMMDIRVDNDGPVTLILDTEEL